MRQHDRAEFHSERSIALNPNDALAAMVRAVCCAISVERRKASSGPARQCGSTPITPTGTGTVARVLHTAGRYAEALDAYSRITERPSFYHAYIAACHAELGQMEEARAQRRRSRRGPISPSARGARICHSRNDADLQRFLDGLRKAGLPE